MTSNTLRAVELVVWVGAVSAAIVAVAALGALVFGDGLVTLKYALFILGFLLFGVGSFGIQPKSPKREKKRFTVDTDDTWGFEEKLQQVPPLRDKTIPIGERVSRDVKMFLTSLVVLGVSLALEYGLGVSV